MYVEGWPWYKSACVFVGQLILCFAARRLIEFKALPGKRYQRYKEFVSHLLWCVLNGFVWRDNESNLRFYWNIAWLVCDASYVIEYRKYFEHYYEMRKIWILRAIWNTFLIGTFLVTDTGRNLITAINIFGAFVLVPLGFIGALLAKSTAHKINTEPANHAKPAIGGFSAFGQFGTPPKQYTV
jgi:hypothetical protein